MGSEHTLNWATGSIRDEMVLLSHSLLRQVVDVLDVAGKLFMEGAPDLMAVNKLR
jgi:hypothetical protein